MKCKRVSCWLVFILTVFIIIGFLSRFLYAEDYYIEKHTETFINEEPTGSALILKLWVKKDWVRIFEGNGKDNITIIRMDEDKAYQVNEKEKTVQEIDLKAKYAAIEKQIRVSSQKTEKKKKIGQREAYQVLLTVSLKGMSTEFEYWLSDKIKFPIETRMRVGDYLGQRKILEELKKYPGYPVETIVHFKAQGKRIERRTRLVKLEKKKIDNHLFEVPSDYKKTELSLKGSPEVLSKPKGKKDKISPQPVDIPNKDSKK